jgi:hypothetical protein
MMRDVQTLAKLELLHKTITLHTVFGVTLTIASDCYRSPTN